MELKDIMYEPNLLETAFSRGQRLDMPGNGFHTLYTRKERLLDGTDVTLAYLVGGLNNGFRYSVVVARTPGENVDIRCGREAGFRFPVPRETAYTQQLAVDIYTAARGLPEEQLLRMEEVPGFTAAGGTFGHRLHDSGDWYTRSMFTYELEHFPVFGEGARAFLLREGVYVWFPDKTIRLIPTKEFWEENWNMIDPPDARQGDLLAWKRAGYGNGDKNEPAKEAAIDRHMIWPVQGVFTAAMGTCWYWVSPGGMLEVRHPEHELLSLPGENGTFWMLRLLPGTSRPFAREGGAD